MKFAFFLLAAIMLCGNARGEIQKVQVFWDAPTCTGPCSYTLPQQFQKIPGVAGVQIDPAAGVAEFRWKPDAPFFWQNVKLAFQFAGPGLRYTRVKVRGVLSYVNSFFVITSLGDNTPFILLGPVAPSYGQYVTQHNIVSHPLTPEMQINLTQGMNQSRVAIIEGRLYDPWRQPQLYLIVEKLEFVMPEQNRR